MSVHSRFDNPTLVGRLETAPIVLRFASLFPRDLKRREMHDKRTGGDLSHIRMDLSHLNTQPVGGPDWIERLLAEIAVAMEHNFEEEIAARERKGRFLEAERLRERGPVDPWKFTREGPLREGIITVNKMWFGGTGHENWDPERVEAFKQRAMEFLLEHFPDAQLREVNIDEDEVALHIHFAVAVWVEKVSQNRGRQWLLQPSANPLLANYEYAQDVAGEAFLDLGIHRGERRAAAARQALAAGVEMPEPRRHVPPSQWRREQRRRALEDRDRILEKSRAEAAATVAGGVALAKTAVKKVRKRAIAEAKARKAEAERAAAATEREREAAETRAEQARQAQVRAQAERERAEEAAVAARSEAGRVQQAAEAEADRIRTEAAAAAAAEQTRSDAARKAREEADTARQAAEQEAAQVIHKAEADRGEAARALARADVVASGLSALIREIAAGTLRLRDNGRVTARAPDLLRPAHPEIAPAVRAAATVAEQTRAARRKAEDVIRRAEEEREAAKAEIARNRAAATDAIAKEREVARDELEKQRLAVTADLDAKRADLDRQETEVKKQWAILTSLLDQFEPLRKRVMRWLSHPDLPPSMKDEGIGLAAEALSLSALRGQVDPDL